MKKERSVNDPVASGPKATEKGAEEIGCETAGVPHRAPRKRVSEGTLFCYMCRFRKLCFTKFD